MFTKNNLEQIEDQGLTLSIVESQISKFSRGFPALNVIAPATLHNGIEILTDEDIFRYIIVFENFLYSGLNAMKFVPASGAASRMFSQLNYFLNEHKINEEIIVHIQNNEYLTRFFSNIEKFAFYKLLKPLLSDNPQPFEIANKLLTAKGLNFLNKPKAQIAFHKYGEEIRTPFEEHLIEAISYCTGSNGISKIHFTISPEHEDGFLMLLNQVKTNYQKRFGIQLNVSFSYQHKTTNTIIVDKHNCPLKNNNEQLVFYPGGHGALIENLNELEADLIFIKNIDNVVPDRLKSETKQYKKALAGYLVTLRNKIFDYCEKLDYPANQSNETLINKIEIFIKKELKIEYESTFQTNVEKIDFFKKILNRPIRVCGMVKNQGEPGGGPFWVKSVEGITTLQILEKAQFDLNNDKHNELIANSTHFNPVDVICCIKNYKGEKFDLNNYVDNSTGFISTKTINGQNCKILELPGLWNGAMSNWTSIFIEVPLGTFNPVKNVIDLLRQEHQ